MTYNAITNRSINLFDVPDDSSAPQWLQTAELYEFDVFTEGTTKRAEFILSQWLPNSWLWDFKDGSTLVLTSQGGCPPDDYKNSLKVFKFSNCQEVEKWVDGLDCSDYFDDTKLVTVKARITSTVELLLEKV